MKFFFSLFEQILRFAIREMSSLISRHKVQNTNEYNFF